MKNYELVHILEGLEKIVRNLQKEIEEIKEKINFESLNIVTTTEGFKVLR